MREGEYGGIVAGACRPELGSVSIVPPEPPAVAAQTVRGRLPSARISPPSMARSPKRARARSALPAPTSLSDCLVRGHCRVLTRAGHQQVALAAHRAEHSRVGGIGLQLLAQAVDAGVDGAPAGAARDAVGEFLQPVARQ